MYIEIVLNIRHCFNAEDTFMGMFIRQIPLPLSNFRKGVHPKALYEASASVSEEHYLSSLPVKHRRSRSLSRAPGSRSPHLVPGSRFVLGCCLRLFENSVLRLHIAFGILMLMCEWMGR